ELPTLSAPLAGDVIELPPNHLRLAGYLSSSIPLLWLRQRDVIGMLGLAQGVCVGDPDLEPLEELIAAAREPWDATPLDGNGGWGPRGMLRDALRLLQIAHILAVTPRALERLHACT